MARLDTGGEDMAHLAQAAQAWLPTDIPGTKQRILDLLAQVAATGANPILELRQGMSWWFGSDAPAMLPPMHLGSERPLLSGMIAMEPLAVLRPPTLWPQRPKRFPDELFTSWLWRASVAAAAPAAAFARDVLGTEYDDADREIAPQIVQRLAQLSGQNFDHLAARVDFAQQDFAQYPQTFRLREALKTRVAAHGVTAVCHCFHGHNAHGLNVGIAVFAGVRALIEPVGAVAVRRGIEGIKPSNAALPRPGVVLRL